MKLYPVILSGGSGSRLWPLSREHYPKPLLPLTSDRTLLQETALRLDGLPELGDAMADLETLRSFFGWCAVIHSALLLTAWAAVTLAGDLVRGQHKRYFDLSDADLDRAYFSYFAYYKLGIWVFGIVPWLALHVIG